MTHVLERGRDVEACPGELRTNGTQAARELNARLLYLMRSRQSMSPAIWDWVALSS
jgi:hypothetical protein